jgi:hypothetical protein
MPAAVEAAAGIARKGEGSIVRALKKRPVSDIAPLPHAGITGPIAFT